MQNQGCPSRFFCTTRLAYKPLPRSTRCAAHMFQHHSSTAASYLDQLEDRHAVAGQSRLDDTLVSQQCQLFRWAVSEGGFVHPHLEVVDTAPCGCRGVVATADISAGSVPASLGKQDSRTLLAAAAADTGSIPLVAIPERLCMSTEDALQLLTQQLQKSDPLLAQQTSPSATHFTKQPAATTSQVATGAGAEAPQLVPGMLQFLGLQQQRQAARRQQVLQQRLHQLQPPMLLALLLAQQRRLGQQSQWAPYIASLPEEPPCAWYADVATQTSDEGNEQIGSSSSSQHPGGQQHKQQQQLQGPHLPVLGSWLSQPLGSIMQQWQAGTSGHKTWQQPSPSPSATPAIPAVSTSLAASAAATSRKAAAAANAVATKCIAAADIFGAALGGLTSAELAWAYGQVVSRAFSTLKPGSIALLPVIDMLNHLAGASVPVYWQEEGNVTGQEQGEASGDGALPRQQGAQEQPASTAGSNGSSDGSSDGSNGSSNGSSDGRSDGSNGSSAGSSNGSSVGGGYWCIWPQQLTEWDVRTGVSPPVQAGTNSMDANWGSGACSSSSGDNAGAGAATEACSAGSEGVVLQAGQELYISYMSSCDAESALLSFGFVPPELQ